MCEMKDDLGKEKKKKKEEKTPTPSQPSSDFTKFQTKHIKRQIEVKCLKVIQILI